VFLIGAAVEYHLVRIYRKLGTGSRAATFAGAHRWALIELG